nr:hypothetical protein Iba_chr11bCG10560 [Ipomoea batatas]GME10525.1 hypothetical protein Iba_scaffold10185CG0040 [Ipomoea batatas]
MDLNYEIRTAPKIISIEAEKFSTTNKEDFEAGEPGQICKRPRNSSLLKNKIVAAQIETAATRLLELLCWNYEVVAALEILHCCRRQEFVAQKLLRPNNSSAPPEICCIKNFASRT